MPSIMTHGQISSLAKAAGLTLRGAFHPDLADGVPEVAAGQPAATVVLLGNAGPAMWRAFSGASPAGSHPLDTWTHTVVVPLAATAGGRAVFPFDRPPLPFQRWAMRAEPVHVSPLGLLIHPEYGLWHAYRAALLLPQRIALPEPTSAASPCATCTERPCLAACPVNAFSAAGYDVPACAGHLRSPAGSTCMEEGCRARDACPVGRAWRYGDEHRRFHMAAFLRARTSPSPG